MQQTQNQLRAQIAIRRDGRTDLETLVDQLKDQQLPGLALSRRSVADELIFREQQPDNLRALAQMAKVNVGFRSRVSRHAHFDWIRNQTFAEALQYDCRQHAEFYDVTAPRTITVIPDTPRSAGSTRKTSFARSPEQRGFERNNGPAARRH